MTSPHDSQELGSSISDVATVLSTLQISISDPSLPRPSHRDVESALNMAVLDGHVDTVRLFLKYGAPITRPTALFATREDHPNAMAIFEALVAHGWDVNSVLDQRDPEVLAMNLIMFHPSASTLLSFFLSHGAYPDGLPSSPGSPLRWVQSLELASMLVCHGAELQHTSALHFAARLPTDALSIPLIRFLLDHGIDIDELEFDGRPVIGVRNRFRDHGTALHVAAKCGSVERIQILVERGADLAKKSRYGYTARDIAQLSEEEDAKVCLETAMRERGLDFEDLVVKDDEEEEEDE